MRKMRLAAGSARTRWGSLSALPDPLAEKRPTSKGRGREGKGKGGEGRGGEGKEGALLISGQRGLFP